MRSILSNTRECFICHAPDPLHRHHIYEGTGRRKISEQQGCWIWLCPRHHNASNFGIHANKELDLKIKQMCEEKWLEIHDATQEDFIEVFGRNYLL